MKFKVTKSSDWRETNEFVYLDTLGDLVDWVEKHDGDVIIKTFGDEEPPELEIYDTWRE